MPYRMILFDFFNTLVVSNPSALPKMEVNGEEVTTTAGLLHAHLLPHHPRLGASQVFQAMREGGLKMRQLRGPEQREPPALERFRHMAHLLDLPEQAAGELLRVHMDAVTGSFRFPTHHRTLLAALREDFRLAIFSNFDYAPALLAILRSHEIERWFDPVVVSETIGFRKPGGRAFAEALALAGLPPREILFVGDSLTDDVEGALGAGIDVAWINLNGQPAPRENAPTYELQGLAGLPALLNGHEAGRPA